MPCSRVQDFAEALDDPQVRARDMVLEVDHPGRGPVRMLGFPMKLTQAPCEIRHPAPEMGAHTCEVLGEVGYDAERISDLEQRGIVGCAQGGR